MAGAVQRGAAPRGGRGHPTPSPAQTPAEGADARQWDPPPGDRGVAKHRGRASGPAGGTERCRVALLSPPLSRGARPEVPDPARLGRGPARLPQPPGPGGREGAHLGCMGPGAGAGLLPAAERPRPQPHQGLQPRPAATAPRSGACPRSQPRPGRNLRRRLMGGAPSGTGPAAGGGARRRRRREREAVMAAAMAAAAAAGGGRRPLPPPCATSRKRRHRPGAPPLPPVGAATGPAASAVLSRKGPPGGACGTLPDPCQAAPSLTWQPPAPLPSPAPWQPPQGPAPAAVPETGAGRPAVNLGGVSAPFTATSPPGFHIISSTGRGQAGLRAALVHGGSPLLEEHLWL